jgi:predicted ATP-dependent endonuclease of OLD family
MEFLYTFKEHMHNHSNKKHHDFITSFEYLEVDSVENFNYPLIKKFVTTGLEEDEVCSFEIDYAYDDREIKMKKLDIYSYNLKMFDNNFKTEKNIENIKLILNNTKYRKAIFSTVFNDGELKIENDVDFMKVLINKMGDNKFHIDLLLGFYEYGLKISDGKNIKNGRISLTISRAFSNSYDIRYINPLRPIFKEVYTKHELQTDEELKYLLELYSNTEYLKKLNLFLVKAKMLEKLEIQTTNVMGSEIFVPIYNDNYKLSISGTGVSQISPIIFELNARNYDKLFIEQPEIHLHPRAQAEFGSVLFDYLFNSLEMSKRRHGAFADQLFIETHSIYILDRLRNDVRKKAGTLENNKNGISIFYLENKNNFTVANNIFVSSDGKFQGDIKSFLSFFMDESVRNLND